MDGLNQTIDIAEQTALTSALNDPEARVTLATLASAMQGMSAKHVAELVAKARHDGSRDRLLQTAAKAATEFTLGTPLAHCEIEAKYRMQGDREKISVTALNKLQVDNPTHEQIEAWMDGILEVLAPICGQEFGRRAKYQVRNDNNCPMRVAWPRSEQ